jgi:hypothetical protein
VEPVAGKKLGSKYFETVFDEYVQEQGLEGIWKIAHKDRGHFREPHGGPTYGLGTLSVNALLKRGSGLTVPDPCEGREVTPYGPGMRYGAILYIEKEGFNELLEESRLEDRYDIGLASNQGESQRDCRR